MADAFQNHVGAVTAGQRADGCKAVGRPGQVGKVDDFIRAEAPCHVEAMFRAADHDDAGGPGAFRDGEGGNADHMPAFLKGDDD